tara:strand:+ start:308 stop:535 length:228 start_codon:yes stop_codon:yes gene_type:complete
MNEILEDLQFLIERLGLNDEQIEETLNITRELGVRPEYFSDEFIFLTDRSFEEDSQLHNPEYLNIALFNAMYWEH